MTALADTAAVGQGGTAPLTDGGLGRNSPLAVVARAVRPALALLPFVAYTGIGLGIPTVAIVLLSFKDNAGHTSLANIHAITQAPYSTAFENSLLLSVLCSVIPGVIGLVLAYAIFTSRNSILKRMVTTASGVFANFGGINLTYMFVFSFGESALVSRWLNAVHLDPWKYGFSLYTFTGCAFVYMYFQIPLMVLVITPALAGLRKSWREAAENLGASSFAYWRTVGIPVLLPSFLGGVLLLFGAAFSAYATAQTLTNGTVNLVTIQIASLINGNVLASEVNTGYALCFGMLVILVITMTGYGLLRRRASRWLR